MVASAAHNLGCSHACLEEVEEVSTIPSDPIASTARAGTSETITSDSEPTLRDAIKGPRG